MGHPSESQPKTCQVVVVRHSNTLRVIACLALLCALALTAVPAVALTPTQVLARARVWINRKVPYSQSRYASIEGTRLPSQTTTYTPSLYGYRTDCSGFVSMCLDLRYRNGTPRSLDTATLDNVMFKIPKSSLRAGDVILRPNDLVIGGHEVPYGHAVIFVRWVNSSHTRYLGYHQSSSAHGSTSAIIDWGRSGFWTAPGFAAYRCAIVHNRSKLSTAPTP